MSLSGSRRQTPDRTAGAVVSVWRRVRRFTDRVTGLMLLIVGLLALGLFAGVNWLAVVSALVFIIFMHELGHYLTARWTGMKVTEFFIGFGPRIWSFHYGETEYGIKALWFGAYVRVVGMNQLEKVDPADEERSFRSKSYPRKLLVLAAGSGMHFIMAWMLLFSILVIGWSGGGREVQSQRLDWTLSVVSEGSAADQAGLAPGDDLISFDGQPVGTFEEFAQYVSSSPKGIEIAVIYERDGTQHSTDVKIGERLTAEGADGIVGMIAGDRILSVEGLHTDDAPSYTEMVEYASSQPDNAFKATIVNALTGEPDTVSATVAEMVDESEATTGFFGIAPHYDSQSMEPIPAAVVSARIFARLTFDIVGALPGLITQGLGGAVGGLLGSGDADVADSSEEVTVPEDLGGRQLPTEAAPASEESRVLSIYGVARLGAEAALGGMAGLTMLLVFVNIFIGVFNLLPVPPLDGGHIAVATYERIRSIRRAQYSVDATRLIPVTYAVMMMLVLIGAIALVRDIIDPVSLG